MPNLPQSINSVVQTANPNTLPDMLRLLRVDRLFQPIDLLIQLGGPGVTSLDLSTLKVDGVIVAPSADSPVELNETVPSIRFGRTLNVVAGVAAPGPRTLVDPSVPASPAFAQISPDGNVLTFEAAVTSLRITYYGAGASPTSDANTPSP